MHISNIKVNGVWTQEWSSLYGQISPPIDEQLIAQENRMTTENETEELEFNDELPPFDNNSVEEGSNTNESDEFANAALVLKGAVFSIVFHEDLIPISGREQGKEIFLSQLINGLAWNIQNTLARNMMMVEDMVTQAAARQDRELSGPNQIEIEDAGDSYGELAGLTASQVLFMADLEGQIDRLQSMLRSCQQWHDKYNSNPAYKMLNESAHQAIDRIRKREAERVAKAAVVNKDALGAATKFLSGLRQAREQELGQAA